jgi:predicted CxxxxCH...CXXCH cytochrome family protein
VHVIVNRNYPAYFTTNNMGLPMGNSSRRMEYTLVAIGMAALVLGGCKPRTHTREEWLNPAYKNEDTFHGSVFVSSSRPLCAVCHGRNLEGRKIGRIEVPGCSTCHFSPGGARVPQGVAWTHGSTGHSKQESSGSVCDACHQVYASYGLEPKSCHGCHNLGVGAHALGQPWLDRKSQEFHATSALECSNCHDLDTKCSTCHFGPSGSKVPEESGWTHGTLPHDSLETYGAVCNQCHSLDRSYGNGPATCHDCHEAHAVPFINHGATAKQNLVYCQSCHAQHADGGPGSNPRFNVPQGSLAAGCESSGCHNQQTAHPVPWKGADATGHQTAGNMENACVLCHGAAFEGSAGLACSTCHTSGLPTVVKNCTSCHDKPPLSGRHTEHNALPEVATVCSICHSGAGSQTASHQNGTVEVSIAAGFNAKSGAASFSAAGKTCSNVSCHGGQVTPGWDTGAIDVNTQCTACHSSSSGQYNSYRSGEHQKHVEGEGISCTECHDTTKLAGVHFNDLATTDMPDASQTIRADRNYNGSSCLFTCHVNNEPHDRGMNW